MGGEGASEALCLYLAPITPRAYGWRQMALSCFCGKGERGMGQGQVLSPATS